MIRYSHFAALGMVAVAITSIQVPWANAQGLRYTTTTTVEMTGRVGAVVNVAASLGGNNDWTETYLVLGDKMRVDRGATSVITDLEWQSVTTLHHDDSTFSVLSFDEILETLNAARGQLDMADFALEEAGMEVVALDEDGVASADSSTAVQFAFDVERTGQKKRIGRYPVEQVLLTVSAEATSEERSESVFAGTIVAINEMWLTPDIEGYQEVRDFEAQAAERLGTSIFGKGGLEKLQTTFARDPRMDAMMADIHEQSMEIDGVPLTTTTYLVLVPDGETFDRDLVFDQQQNERRGLQGALRAVRRGIRSEGSNEEREGQRTLVRILVELKDFAAGGLTSVEFEPPSSYTEKILEN